uniref:Uncharacterized protein n=1 Tax=Leviviridae sp. TaxID=2027243 RepID=A0A514DCL0_9VIRU|nr:MAG: hypothetical protein H1Rhizo271040_000002 [Leviviridae sp.]
MFVRNNMKCPNCGRSAATDLYLSPNFAASTVGVVLRAECFECLGFVELSVNPEIVRRWLRGLASSFPPNDIRRLPMVWSDRPGFSPRRWLSFYRVLSEVFCPGEVNLKSLEHPILSHIVVMIRSSVRADYSSDIASRMAAL